MALALDAQMKCVGPKGERLIAATDFFTFAYTTALENDEILTEVIFPVPSNSRGVYLKLERVAGDFAIASAAVQIELDKNGICRVAGIGVTGAGVVAQKALPVENLLQRKRITSELIEEAGRIIQQGAEPVEDTRGSAAYKKKVLGAVLKRALREALQRSRS